MQSRAPDVPCIAIGTLVEPEGMPGRVCGTRSTLFFPDGIYPVEHEVDGRPVVKWWHAEDMKPVTIQ